MTIPATYAHWRARIPFTDDAIAAALDAEADAEQAAGKPNRADWIRGAAARLRQTSRLSAFWYRLALPRLVTRCFCGKTALYRYGTAGRCRAHRDVQTLGFRARLAQLDAQSADVGQQITDEARAAKRHETFQRGCVRSHRTRHR